MAHPWWKRTTIYQIYPRSFCDTSGNGVGDLEGIRRHLDHLVDLGVGALWLSPFYRSPMADFGYDVADYEDVDPLFGTLQDFDRLLAEAHQRDLRVVIDWVPNHSSDHHPWFVAARSSRDDPKRDWYVWRDGTPDRPPNNWRAALRDAPAWTWDEATEQWYLHLFLAEQPDLNWGNPAVVEAMQATLRFWLDRGVDGFRMDVVHALGKDPTLADDPPGSALPHASLNDDARTHPILRDLRRLLDAYPGDRMMVGEVYLLDTATVATYYGDGDELHLSFNFPPLYTRFDAMRWRRQVESADAELGPRGAWPTWVLSNHDNPRHRTRYGGDERRARAAALLLLGLRGTPFLYAGEELGLEDAVVTADRAVDPGGRDGCRAPMPWDASPTHGWAGEDPWLPWPPEAAARNAEVLRQDPSSILHLYRRLLAARRASEALQVGDQQLLDLGPDLLGWTRSAAGDDVRGVVVCFADGPRTVDVGPGWVVEVATDGQGEGLAFDGTVPGPGGVVLRRA